MKWNEQEGYVKYKSSLTSLKTFLGGIGNLDIYIRPELAPYITHIISYLNTQLTLMDEGTDLKGYIQEIMDIFSYGADMIVIGDALGLAIEVGIDTGTEWNEDDELPYCQDRFVFCWSNIMTYLTTLLKLLYAGLFAQETEDCLCECGGRRVNVGHDNDEWQSGIYPEDENYDWISKDNTIKVGWKVSGTYIDQCTRCNRIEK